MHKSKIVNTKRRSSNNKKPLGVIVTGLTSTPAKMSDEINGNHHSPVMDQSVDSGLSSEIEKPNGVDEHHQRESSPTSGVIVPEEKRVTDRVKVFEAVANKKKIFKFFKC